MIQKIGCDLQFAELLRSPRRKCAGFDFRTQSLKGNGKVRLSENDRKDLVDLGLHGMGANGVALQEKRHEEGSPIK